MFMNIINLGCFFLLQIHGDETCAREIGLVGEKKGFVYRNIKFL